MKVVHVAYTIGGGAGRAAFRLCEALHEQGVDLKFLSIYQEKSAEPFFVNWSEGFDKKKWIVRDLERLHRSKILKNRNLNWNTFFSLSHPSINLLKHPLIREADILHFHWIAGYVSPSQIYALHKAGKKIFWTLHDEWAYTGGCHYTAGCEGYKSVCRSCPQLVKDDWGIPEKSLAEKQESYRHIPITVVGPSRWIADSVRSSTVFRNHEVHHIPYSLDLNIFKPHEKVQAKIKLGLSPKKKWILFGADNGAEIRKGSHILVEALRRMEDLKEKIGVMAVGYNHPEFPSTLPVETKVWGHEKSDERLALIYSAADFLALPSLQDNLPNLMLESLACGTPVLSFGVGGMTDHISSGLGRLALNTDAASFEKAARELLEDIENDSGFSQRCRAYAEENFNHKTQGSRYLELYKNSLALNHSSLKQKPRLLTDLGYFFYLAGGWRPGARLRLSYFIWDAIPEYWAKTLDFFEKKWIRVKRKIKPA